MVDEAILREIDAGESKTLELKIELPEQSEKYIKTLVAFANTAGGRLIVGVRNSDREIVGVPDASAVMDAIANTLMQMCVPLLTPSIYRLPVHNNDLIVVEVYPGANTPYYIKSKGVDSGTYVRIGATTALADEAMIKELMLRGARQTFDEQIHVGTEYNEKDALELCAVIDEYRRKGAEEKGNEAPKTKTTPQNLENWGLLRRFEGRLMPTRAFMLLTTNPFQFAKTQCAQFKGTDRVVFLDRREYGGSLYQQIEEAVQFVLRNIRYGAEIKGLLREDSFELPIVAIREAIVNATIHRSLQQTSCVQVALYDDRLEVSSPGALYGSLTLEAALSGKTALRNPIVAEAFKQMELYESWGTGLRRIQESCKKLGLDDPEFLEIGDMFRVNLFRPPLVPHSEVTPKVTQKVTQKTPAYNPEKLEKEILGLLKENPEMTRKELAKKTGVSESSVSRRLSALKKAKTIEYHGSARDGRWIIN